MCSAPRVPRVSARPSLTLLLSALVLAAGCGTEPSDPPVPEPQPRQLLESAVQLRIDVPTGRVHVVPPAPSLMRATTSLASSLAGSDLVEVEASNCSFVPVPNSRKRIRCLLSLALTNRSKVVDLVTPTTFPRPPQGTNGVLVFPLTAAALGVPGGSAIPSPEWDLGPHNFFNDFGSCGTSTTSDCYRYKLYASPLASGRTSASQIVGFDVDRDAQSVAVYFVVAADVRDHYTLLTTTIPAEQERSGYVNSSGFVSTAHLAGDGSDNSSSRMFFSFDLGVLPRDAIVVAARLQGEDSGGGSGDPYGDLGDLLVDHVELGAGLDAGDFASPALEETVGTFSTARFGTKSLEVTLQLLADLGAGRTHSEYRVGFARLTDDDGEIDSAVFHDEELARDHGPRLVVIYRRP